MKKPILLITFGLAVVFASLWGGCWLCAKFPPGNTYNTAAEATSVLTAILGFALVIIGGLWIWDKKGL